jgi:intein/homing endonuclease
MSDGSEKLIEDVRVGDRVLGYDRGRIVEVSVLEERSHAGELGYYIINGLKITPTNPIWVNDEYILPEYVEIGDMLLNSDAKDRIVTSKKFVASTVEIVYSLVVSGSHNYFAGGYLVHNKVPPLCGCLPGQICSESSCESNSRCRFVQSSGSCEPIPPGV